MSTSSSRSQLGSTSEAIEQPPHASDFDAAGEIAREQGDYTGNPHARARIASERIRSGIVCTDRWSCGGCMQRQNAISSLVLTMSAVAVVGCGSNREGARPPAIASQNEHPTTGAAPATRTGKPYADGDGPDVPADGPCRLLPRLDVVISSCDRSTRWLARTHVAALDLDGTGSTVVLVPHRDPNAHPNDIVWSLHVSRSGACPEIGVVQGLSDPTASSTSSRGLFDLESTRAGSCFPSDTCLAHGDGCRIVDRYRFDGVRYRASVPESR